jgi:hypothetical protein
MVSATENLSAKDVKTLSERATVLYVYFLSCFPVKSRAVLREIITLQKYIF